MEIKALIDSGILETYVMGIATDDETKKVLAYKEVYPEFRDALEKLELDMEMLAQSMAINPPPGILERIENEINEIQLHQPNALQVGKPNYEKGDNNDQEKYINVESSSSHMRIHKAWRWIFAAVFILGKIFLATAIYFYLENRQAQIQLKELKLELQQKR
ncbi:hypothetical protein [Pedobacter nototheniae]|uniref:hypothetical protein n=1 Tax=Pedobacter nototheniae TaxID=2488994 RepID=UPI00103F403C|nr:MULTISPECIES: hypothetical protein [Pedobacter]